MLCLRHLVIGSNSLWCYLNFPGATPTKRKSVESTAEGPKPKKKRKQKNKKSQEKSKAKNESSPDSEAANADLDMSAWEGLFVPEPVLQSLRHQGFSTPTEIQRAMLPAAIRGRMDLLGAAETGSGKTLAFGIPIINGILEDNEREESTDASDVDDDDDETATEVNNKELISDEEFEDMSDEEGTGCVKVVNDVVFDFEDEGEFYAPPIEIFGMDDDDASGSSAAPKKGSGKQLRALVLTPTRELAIQVQGHIERAAKFTDIRVAVVVGGMSAQKQERVLSYGPEIVVATPGRLWDLIQEGNQHLAQVTDIKYLAIDETDRMVEKGHFAELRQLLDLINSDEAKKSR